MFGQESTPPQWVQDLDDLHLMTPLRILVVVLVASILMWIVRRLVNGSLKALQVVKDKATPGSPESARSELRYRTLRSVLVSSISAFVWLTAAVIVLALLGVNVGAFVAVTAVIGGAIGFGANQMVRDFINGFFVLSEDQYGVGDLVDVGHATGIVEAVSLRSTRLRDNEGRVWYVPNGQIERAANMSHDWARAVLDVPVDRDIPYATARDDLLAVGRSVADEPALRGRIMGEPEVVGIQDLLDDRMVLRVQVKTKPAAQFEVLRALRVALLAAQADGRLPVPDGTTTMILRSDNRVPPAASPVE
ncbi:MAG TPA: mechanosensitive ion channel family protein [Acidimicrobiales bacterium]